MSKLLWNLDHQPVVVSWQEPAIMPGESHEFTDEQVAAGLTGLWGDEDPRAGLKAERAFKQRRDQKAKTAAKSADDADTNQDPAESGEKE